MDTNNEDLKSKILISGTGRCGTTFLMTILTFLGYNTGFNKDNYRSFIFDNCNSGLEENVNSEALIIKNPSFIADIDDIIKSVKIKYMIIPIRNYEDSAKSREKHEFDTGGFFEANTYEEQLTFYNKIMSNYLLRMVKYDIPTIFIDFDKMISDPKYLYLKLKPILNDISEESFINSFIEASSKR